MEEGVDLNAKDGFDWKRCSAHDTQHSLESTTSIIIKALAEVKSNSWQLHSVRKMFTNNKCCGGLALWRLASPRRIASAILKETQ